MYTLVRKLIMLYSIEKQYQAIALSKTAELTSWIFRMDDQLEKWSVADTGEIDEGLLRETLKLLRDINITLVTEGYSGKVYKSAEIVLNNIHSVPVK